MKDYSQNCEQKIILDYFGGEEKVRGLRGMRLLDIGANDGVTFSMSRALIDCGFGAVLVEPSPEAFKRLYDISIARTGDIDPSLVVRIPCVYGKTDEVCLVNAAITTKDGPIDFYESGTHLKKGDVALLSTTRPEEMDRWKKSGEVFTKTTVRGITFATLMNELSLLVTSDEKFPSIHKARFDLISIDAEGCDYSILAQIDLTAVGCKMLCVEFNQRDERKFTEYCARFGMRLHRKTYENLIYAR